MQIDTNGGKALAIPADVTDPLQVEESVAAIERVLGPVTLLVNNAGTPGPVGADWEVDADDWWRCIEVSVRGAFLCSRAVLPQMVDRRCGRIINVAGGTGIRAVPGLTGTADQVRVYNPPTVSRANLNYTGGVYAQDSWTIDRLTLNMGLRVDWPIPRSRRSARPRDGSSQRSPSR